MHFLAAILLLQLCIQGGRGLLSGGCQKAAATSGWVCVCDASGCDELPASAPGPGTLDVFTSSAGGGPFLHSNKSWSPKKASFSLTESRLTVDPSLLHQEILGFGGAFTDAAGINIARLPSSLQDDLVASYFDPQKGSAYTIGRIPIASCDFSTREYSYDDAKGDLSLSKFALAPEDTKYKIPLIKAAKKLAGGALRLFGSPWSAPGWMKTSGTMNGNGTLIGSPGGKYYKAWAQYLVKFLEAYASAGLPLWAMTVQNEPSTGFIPKYSFQTMGYTAKMERDFLRLDLGPALAASSQNTTKIIIMDDQRVFVTGFTKTVLSDPAAASFVSGVGLHWYEDAFTPAALIDAAHKAHPDVFFLATEACTGSLPWETRGVTLGSWKRGSEYASSVITDLNHWVGGWVDWNLALSTKGGPNWVNNVVDAPIIVSHDGRSFFKQPMYYALAHFSKFIPPGSHRVGQSFSSGWPLSALSALTPDGHIVSLILNKDPYRSMKVRISEKGRPGSALLKVPPHSITSVKWAKNAT